MLWKEGKAHFARNLCFSFFIILCQGIGAILGCAICLMAFPFKKKDLKEVPVGSDDFWVAQLCPVNGCNDDGDNVLRVFAVETVCTFMFVTFVLVIAKHNGAADTPINTMAIGLALYCAVREASGISRLHQPSRRPHPIDFPEDGQRLHLPTGQGDPAKLHRSLRWWSTPWRILGWSLPKIDLRIRHQTRRRSLQRGIRKDGSMNDNLSILIY